MDEFRTICKLWPAATELNLGTDSNLLGGPATFTRNATNFVTDGTQNYQFLFWNTGRHMTNKRQVRWNFSVLGWGTWTAIKWYGTPSGGPGTPRVRADAFTIGGDAPLSGTPIDATSTYAPGAWPFGGDDHVIGTAAGAANVVAKDPFPSVASSSYDFAGWLQLVWGGDPTSEFVETDVGPGGSGSGFGVYDHVAGGAFPVAMGASADLLATYGTKHSNVIDPGVIQDFLRDILEKFAHLGEPGGLKIPGYVDPSPIDFIRLKVLEQFLQQTRPGSGGGTDFQRLIEAAPGMSREELTRSMQSLKTTLGLGETALTAIEAQLKRSGK